MISKKLYINIIIRVSIIVALSVLLGYFIVREQSLRFSIICSVTIILLTVSLISYLNRTNRNIRFFFRSTYKSRINKMHVRNRKVNISGRGSILGSMIRNTAKRAMQQMDGGTPWDRIRNSSKRESDILSMQTKIVIPG